MTRDPARKSLRIFQNDILESLSRASPAAVMAFWVPVAALALGAGVAGGLALGPLLCWTVATALFWSLFEYCIHRFGFHARIKGVWGERMTFVIHGCHHVDPGDPMRNVMPLSVTIPIGLVLYGIDRLLFAPATGFWIGGVFALSYVFYDVMHWRTHQRPSGTRVERFLRKHHMLHHFSQDHSNFGVTSPLWDILFGTFAPHGRATRELKDGSS